MYKSAFIKLTIIGLFLLLMGCAGSGKNPNAGLQVKLWLEGKQPYKVGDELVVNVRADRACYLYLFYLAGNDMVRRIYPLRGQREMMTRPGEIYRIPSANAAYTLTLMPPPSKETIIAVATYEPVALVPADKIDNSSLLPRIKMTRYDFKWHLNQVLKNRTPESWDRDVVHFSYH